MFDVDLLYKIQNMTNKEFANIMKDEHMRSDQVLKDVRSALNKIGVKTSAYNSRIDPHSAAWILYATIMAPSPRTSTAEWIIEKNELFTKKAERREVSPIALLWMLFDRPEKANDLDRVTIDQRTGDIYAFLIDDVENPIICRADLEGTPRNESWRYIQYLVQIGGDYFRAYHEWTVKQN